MPDTHYRLYYSPGACSLASHIALKEFGANYEATEVVIADGATCSRRIWRLTPVRLPSLVIRDDDGGRVLLRARPFLSTSRNSIPSASYCR